MRNIRLQAQVARIGAVLAKARPSVGLRLLFAGILLAIAALTIGRLASDWRALPGDALSALHLDLRLLALAWLVQTAGWVMVGRAWRSILGPEGSSLSLLRHLQLYTLAGLTQVLPGSIWAPLSRVALYRRMGVAGLAVSAGLVVELSLLGLAGLALYGLAAPLVPVLPPGWAPWLGLVAVLALGLLHPRAFGEIFGLAWRRFGKGEMPAPPAGGRLLGLFAIELCVLGLSGLSLWLLMLAISPAASLPWAMAVWGLTVAVANLLAWLPATSLLKDGGMVVLLTPLYAADGGPVGRAAFIALAVTLAWRFWSLAVLASWAALATLVLRIQGVVGLSAAVDAGPIASAAGSGETNV